MAKKPKKSDEVAENIPYKEPVQEEVGQEEAVAQENKTSKNQEIPVKIYLESIGKKSYEMGGIIAFVDKKSKKKLQTPEEWKKLLSEY